jgi:5-oxoprolinase (ATP-hydrolysing)
MLALHRYANDCIQKKLGEILKSETEATEMLDDGSVLKVKISKLSNKYTFDFLGTAPQHPANMNATPAIVNSVVLYVLRLLIDDDIPLNEGILENVSIHLPICLLNPVFPDDPAKCPAVVGGNVEVSQRLVDTLLKAFNLAACSQGTMNNLLFGNQAFGFYETICGGVGAGKDFAGASAVHQHMTNTKITDPEIMELRYPVRIEKFCERKDSGGIGKWRGGNGVERQIKFLEPVKLTILSQHRNEGPYGIQGGEPGKKGEQWLIGSDGKKELLPGIGTLDVEANESVLIKTPGGGAYGKY